MKKEKRRTGAAASLRLLLRELDGREHSAVPDLWSGTALFISSYQQLSASTYRKRAFRGELLSIGTGPVEEVEAVKADPVWVAVITHPQGSTVFVGLSEKAVRERVLAYVRGWWRATVGEEPMPDQADSVIAAYFSRSKHEEVMMFSCVPVGQWRTSQILSVDCVKATMR